MQTTIPLFHNSIPIFTHSLIDSLFSFHMSAMEKPHPIPTAPPAKPRILCLHGGGTSAYIFAVQTIRLRRLLPQYEFIFVSGPFESVAGPGVLPYFEGMGPFYRWRRAARGARVPMTEQDLRDAEGDDEEVDRLLDDVLSGRRTDVCRSAEGLLGSRPRRAPESARATPEPSRQGTPTPESRSLEKISPSGGDGPFVGVIGFSQGGGVASRLLLRQEETARARDAGQQAGESRPADEVPYLKFGVFVGASPQCLYSTARLPPKHLAGADLGQVVKNPIPGLPEDHVESSFARIVTPSLHVHGKNDPYLSNAQTLLRLHYDPATTQLMEFEGGHHMPVQVEDSQQVADFIVRMTES
jgi:pimeloyl-ACP methyl ester carboxylesterase